VKREAYRLATLAVHGLQYFVSQASSGVLDRPSAIDGFETRAIDIEQDQLPPVALEVFRYSFFVYDWNCSIHFAGTRAELILGEPLEFPSQ
jgi:hypothetical protein